MDIAKFSVKNPVLINILMVAILAIGGMSLLKLPRELWSEISFSTAWIAVPYPGVSAEDVEKSITIPIEQELSDLDRLKRITSVSRRGVSFVSVEFEDDVSDAEFKSLYQDMRTEFDKVALPEDALDAQINEFTTSDFMPIIQVILGGEKDKRVLYEAAENLKEDLLDLPDVSKVEVVGAQERKVLVEADRARLQGMGVSLDELIGAVQTANLNIPAGRVTSGTRDYLLRTIGEMKDPKQLGEIIVRNIPGQGIVKVQDLAQVTDGYGESVYDSRFNGEKSIALFISKKKDASSFALVDSVKSVVKKHKALVPSWITMEPFNDTSFYIREVVDTLTTNSMAGFVLVVVVLLFFLGLRNSLLTALGIPMTFAITFIAMAQYGESLNGNSLFALVLVLGMIVDHAIVIVENAYRHRQRGLSPREAAIVGTREVARPVIAATLTTVAAFLPAMLISGVMGKFMRVIPLVVCFALVASTFEALLFLPVHFSEWGSRRLKQSKSFFLRWKGFFQSLIATLFRHRYWTVTGSTLTMLLILGASGLIKQDMFAGEEFTQFNINIKMAMGTNRPETDRIVKKLETCVEQFQGEVGHNASKGEILSVNSTTGFANTGDDWITSSRWGQLTVDVAELQDGRTRPVPVIMQEVKDSCDYIAGAESIDFKLIENGPPVDKPVSFRLRGEDFTEMSYLSDEFKKILNKHQDVLYNIGDDYEKGSPEFQVKVDPDLAAQNGLSVAQVGMQLRNAVEGAEVGTYFDNDDELDILVRLKEADRDSEEDILNITFFTPDGRQIPFSSIAKIERNAGAGAIKRYDQSREIMVFAESWDDTKVPPILEEVRHAWETQYETAYPGVKLVFGGAFADFQNFIGEFISLLALGVALMYLILGAQFNSYFQPILMLSTLFFAASGCIAFLLISGTPFSVVVAFAGMALAGICVNDSIVLISYINDLRKSGASRNRAVIQGAVTRLRPVILTSITTIGGLLPMSLGIGGESTTWGPMASTVVFGLLFSTFGTLVFIPCAYGVLDDVQRFAQNAGRVILSKIK